MPHHVRTESATPPNSTERWPRRPALQAAGALLFLALLTACGALVPPQSATDPFGVDGAAVVVSFGGAGPALAPMAVTGNASGTFEFPDFEQSLPLSPRVIENQIGLTSASLNDPDGPATITLTSADLVLRLWHGAADYASAGAGDRAEMSLSTDGAVVLQLTTCNATSCSYDVDGAVLGSFSLSGGPLSGFINVASNPPAPNQGQVTLEVEAEEDELAGSTLTLVLDASQGTLRF